MPLKQLTKFFMTLHKFLCLLNILYTTVTIMTMSHIHLFNKKTHITLRNSLVTLHSKADTLQMSQTRPTRGIKNMALTVQH